MLQGTIEGHEHSYTLDDKHTLEKGRPMLVCGNTAAMLGEGGVSHLARHFQARKLHQCLGIAKNGQLCVLARWSLVHVEGFGT